MRSSIRRFFSDARGRRVIAQPPNAPLVAWALCGAAAYLLPPGRPHDVAAFLSSAFLFTWAWLELTDGDSPFRRVLGGAVLAAMVAVRVLRP